MSVARPTIRAAGGVLGLVGLGLVMVYSASAITASDKLGDGFRGSEAAGDCRGHRAGGHGAAMKLGYRRMAWTRLAAS